MIMKRINVASIIINYKDKYNCLALAKKLISFPHIDLVVIVNNSKDNFFISRNYLNRIIVLTPNDNLGFSKGNNFAFEFINRKYLSNYILVINSDILISCGTFLKVYQTMVRNKHIGLLSCNMKNADGTYTVNHWIFMNYKDCCCECLYLLKKFGRSSKTIHRGLNYVDVVRMSFGLCRQSVMKTIRFFDDKFFLYYEEDKLCKKIKKTGYDVCLLDNGFYIHNHPISKEMQKSVKSLIKSKTVYFESMFNYARDYLGLRKFQLLFLRILTQYAKFEKILFIYIRKYLISHE